MKKFFIIFLASLMVLSFAACGGKTDNVDSTTAAPAGSTEGTQPDSTEALTTTAIQDPFFSKESRACLRSLINLSEV